MDIPYWDLYVLHNLKKEGGEGGSENAIFDYVQH